MSVLDRPLNFVMYNLAGHNEYHTSHAAILETLIHKSPAIFMILVDLRKGMEDIKRELFYWASILMIQRSKISSRVIVVGSHADQLASLDPRQLKNKHVYIPEIAEDVIGDEQFGGFVSLDCRQLSVYCVGPLLEALHESCEDLAFPEGDYRMPFSCHLLHSLLLTDNIKKMMAITLQEMMELIASERQPSLPSDLESVATSLEILADKGLIVFRRNRTDISSSCMVINQRAVLEEVDGKLFAPVTFKEHCQIVSNTGIVPVSLLSKTFRDHFKNIHVLVVFLMILELCHELESTVLKTISTNLSMGSTSGERLLFFPALVSVDRQVLLAIAEGFGWAVFCKNPYQILSTYVLQVIILRLAFKFCFPKRSGADPDVPPLHKLGPPARECTVWKNGIHWTTEDGIKAVVEVSEQHRHVSVIVSWDESSITEHINLRSSLIAEILAILDSFCPNVELEEYVTPSCEVMQLLSHNPTEMSVFSMRNVARCILHQQDMLSSADMNTKERISSLLFIDPYQLLHPRVV